MNVTLAPMLKGVRFLAFGDSITWGEVADPASVLRYSFQPDASYPAFLQLMLQDHYRRQMPVVINAGEPGETARCQFGDDDCAEERLVDQIRVHGPDAVLLMEGVNDLNQGVAPAIVSDALRSTVRRAFGEGVLAVFLSTILPEVPGRPKAFAEPGSIEATNALIRAWAAPEGAVLVDGFAAVDPLKDQLIGEDGLHPTPEGNRVLAETFLAAIRDGFESASDTAPAGVRSSGIR